MALEFSRGYLSGKGDILKLLSALGLPLTANQTPADEYVYLLSGDVNQLAAEMRDGARLCRLLHAAAARYSLAALAPTGPVRLPASSRLQRIHNVSMALAAMAGAGAPRYINLSMRVRVYHVNTFPYVILN